MIREKEDIHFNKDSRVPVTQRYDWTDLQNEVSMYRYRIVEISEAKLDLKVTKSFVGPGVTTSFDYGLYAGDELDMFVLFFKDSQEKMKLTYCQIAENAEPFEKTPFETFYYVTKVAKA